MLPGVRRRFGLVIEPMPPTMEPYTGPPAAFSPWQAAHFSAKIASRAVDSTNYVQPTVADLAKDRFTSGFVQHHNGIFPWSVSETGEVANAIA